MIRYIFIRISFLIITFFLIVTFLFMSTRVAHLNIWTQNTFFQNVGIAFTQYQTYIKGIILENDWGMSLKDEPLWDLFKDRMPVTLRVNLFAFLIYVPLGMTLGIIAALKKDSWVDHVISVFTLLFTSVPSFILIFALIYILGYTLNWLPPIYPVGATGIEAFKGLLIPFLALAITPIAHFTRLTRGEFVETFQSDFFLLLRTKGLKKSQTIFRHGLKNALIPILTEIPHTFILVIGGSFFIEKVYNIPGVSRIFFDAIVSPIFDTFYINIHTPTVVIVSAFYALLTLVTGFLSDVLVMLLDPRIKIGSKGSNTRLS